MSTNRYKPRQINLPGKNPGENLCRETVITFEVKLKASSTPGRRGKRKKAFKHFHLRKQQSLNAHPINVGQ